MSSISLDKIILCRSYHEGDIKHVWPQFDLRVGSKLYLASKLTENAGLVYFARYIKAPIALRYGISRQKNFSSSPWGKKWSFSKLSDQTTIGVLKGWALFI